MRRSGVGAVSLMAIVGCTSAYSYSTYKTANYETGQVLSGAVGSPLLVSESGERTGSYVIDHLQKQLIYSGKSGSVVRFEYREFRSSAPKDGQGSAVGNPASFARPADKRDISYDLDESDVIAFQDIRLKVLRSSNESITVAVLESGIGPGTPGKVPAETCFTDEPHSLPYGWNCQCDLECQTGLACVDGNCKEPVEPVAPYP
jgi:hypothetical protein